MILSFLDSNPSSPPLSTPALTPFHSQNGKSPATATNPSLLNSPADRKLRKAAGEFESLLLSNLWKSMKSTFADDANSTDPAHDTLENWGIDAMSSAVGKAGGLGLGKLILKHLEPLLAHSQNATKRQFQ
jgi:Rod binding domain-containing protein